VVTGAEKASAVGPLTPVASIVRSTGTSLGSHIVFLDRVVQRDVPVAAVDTLNHIPSDRVPQKVARAVSCDPRKLHGYSMGTLMTCLSQNEVILGYFLGFWARENAEVPPL